MCNPGYRLPFVKTRLAEQRPRRQEKHPLPDTLFYLFQNISRQDDRRAAAAGTSRIGILLFAVEDLHTAVHMLLRDIDSVFGKQLEQKLLAH